MIVYWTSYIEYPDSDYTFSLEEPKKLHQNIPSPISKSNYPLCGAFNEQRNLFVVNSPLAYTLNIDRKTGEWKSPDNSLLDRYTLFDDFNYGILQFKTNLAMYSPKPLKLRLHHPFLHHTSLTEAGNLMTGAYDCSKWLRPLNAVYYFKMKDNWNFKVTQNTPLMYIEFDIPEKIELKYLHPTKEIQDVLNRCLTLKETRRVPYTLKECYARFEQHKSKKILAQEIRKQER